MKNQNSDLVCAQIKKLICNCKVANVGSGAVLEGLFEASGYIMQLMDGAGMDMKLIGYLSEVTSIEDEYASAVSAARDVATRRMERANSILMSEVSSGQGS